MSEPDAWCEEVGDPRYLVDLVKRIVTVRVETVRIVDGLPPLEVMGWRRRPGPLVPGQWSGRPGSEIRPVPRR
ncbi:MAG: hypothetical protein ACRDY3_10425 [Acidimicrobiales bacterium]